MLQQDVRIVGMQPGPFDRRRGNKFRVIHKVLVDRRVPRRVDDHRPRPRRPTRPACCQKLAIEPGCPLRMHRSRSPISIPSSKALVVMIVLTRPACQIAFQLPPLVGQQSAPIRFYFPGQFAVSVGDRAADRSTCCRARQKQMVRTPSRVASRIRGMLIEPGPLRYDACGHGWRPPAD